ncbi:MAG: hypothetical protein QF886_10245, partial [Planctomycetota bacterium]|nr:hypothetical protein [Planctomycetota bacterium]
MDKQSIFLTDLQNCIPRSAIADRNAPGCWRAVEYDLGELSGTMLLGGPETEAAPVTLELGAHGWHSVYLGLWPQYGMGEKDMMIRVKLSGDGSFVPVRAENQSQYEVEEVFWKSADLAGQDIAFRQYHGGFRAGIAYVKLARSRHPRFRICWPIGRERILVDSSPPSITTVSITTVLILAW